LTKLLQDIGITGFALVLGGFLIALSWEYLQVAPYLQELDFANWKHIPLAFGAMSDP